MSPNFGDSVNLPNLANSWILPTFGNSVNLSNFANSAMLLSFDIFFVNKIAAILPNIKFRQFCNVTKFR